jgi:hypothetical protein
MGRIGKDSINRLIDFFGLPTRLVDLLPVLRADRDSLGQQDYFVAISCGCW